MLVALIRGGCGWAWLSLFVMVLALALFRIYGSVLAQGMRPFPTAPHSDLPSVLKALYLQHQFIRFMVRQQGARQEALQAAFAELLATHRPVSGQPLPFAIVRLSLWNPIVVPTSSCPA